MLDVIVKVESVLADGLLGLLVAVNVAGDLYVS